MVSARSIKNLKILIVSTYFVTLCVRLTVCINNVITFQCIPAIYTYVGIHINVKFSNFTKIFKFM